MVTKPAPANPAAITADTAAARLGGAIRPGLKPSMHCVPATVMRVFLSQSLYPRRFLRTLPPYAPPSGPGFRTASAG